MIAAGNLRDRVDYQEATEAADTFGQLQPTWSTQWSAWANVQALDGREAELARQIQATASHAVTVRGPRSLSTRGRFLWTDPAGIARVLNVSEPPRFVELDWSEIRVVCAEQHTN